MQNMPHPAVTPTGQCVVLLAAGAGTRFEEKSHKLLAVPDTAADTTALPVIARSLAHAIASRVGPVIVVTGALGADDLRAAPGVAELLGEFLDDEPDATIRHNPQWARGQSTSLMVGIDAARSMGATSVVVGLADQPFIPPAAWRAVADGSAPICVATYDGQRGNPVRLHRDVWELLPSDGDEGARVLMRSRPDLVTEVPCTGSPADIDTVEDLRRWQSN